MRKKLLFQGKTAHILIVFTPLLKLCDHYFGDFFDVHLEFLWAKNRMHHMSSLISFQRKSSAFQSLFMVVLVYVNPTHILLASFEYTASEVLHHIKCLVFVFSNTYMINRNTFTNAHAILFS